MSESLGRAVLELDADGTKLGRGLDDAESRTHKLASALGKTVAVGAAVAGAAIGAFAVSSGKAAIELDGKLHEINTLFGLSGEAGKKNFGDIAAIVRKVSDNVGVAQQTIAGGLYQAISAGVPKENAFSFMMVASKAAIAGVTDTETAVDGLSSIINAFGLDAKDADAVADSMFTTVKGGKTTFSELSDAVFNIAPAAAAAKVSFKEVNAAIATLTAQGVPTSVATTQMRAALSGLMRPSADMTAIFQNLGYANAQAAVEAKGMTFALGAVRDAAGGDQGQLQTLLGSVEAVSAANILAGTGAKKMAQEMKNQGTAAGSTQAAYEEMNNSLGRVWARLTTRVKNYGIAIAQKAIPAMTKFLSKASEIGSELIKKFGPAVKSMAKAFQEAGPPILKVLGDLFENVKKYIVPIFVSLMEIGQKAIKAIGKVLKDNGPQIQTIFKNLGRVIKDLAAVVMPILAFAFQKVLPAALKVAIPVLAKLTSAIAFIADVVTAVLKPLVKFTLWIDGAFVSAFSAPIKALNGFCDIFTKTIPNAIMGALSWMRSHWPEIATIISGPFAPLVALATDGFGIRSKLIAAFSAPAQWIGGKISAVATAISNKVGEFGTAGAKLGGRVKDKIIEIISAPGQWIGGKVSNIASAIAGYVSYFTTAGGKLGTALFNGIWDAIKNIGTKIANAVKVPINAVIRALNAIKTGAKKITIPVPFAPDVSFTIPSIDIIPGTIPTLDTGAIVSEPTLAMLSMNRKREAVVPLPSGGLGSLGNTYHLHFEGPIMGEQEWINRVRRGLQKTGVRVGEGNLFAT